MLNTFPFLRICYATMSSKRKIMTDMTLFDFKTSEYTLQTFGYNFFFSFLSLYLSSAAACSLSDIKKYLPTFLFSSFSRNWGSAGVGKVNSWWFYVWRKGEIKNTKNNKHERKRKNEPESWLTHDEQNFSSSLCVKK